MAENKFSTIRADIKSTASYIKDMADAVKDIDDAMTELYKVTDETDKRYEHYSVAGNGGRDTHSERMPATAGKLTAGHMRKR